MEKLGIDLKLLIAQITNFALFFFIFQKFIAKPFMSFIKNEEKKDKEKAGFEEEMKVKKEELKKQERQLKEEMEARLKKELSEAKKEAEALKKEMIEQARNEAVAIVAEAKKQMANETKMMEESLNQKAADLSVILLKKALKEHLTESMQADITQNILKRLHN